MTKGRMMQGRHGIEALVVAISGALIIIVPVAFDPNSRQYDAEFLPIVRTAVKDIKFEISLPLLMLLGIIAAALSRLPVWALGVSAIAVFPLWSIADVAAGGSHTLLPIEWAVYAFYALPVIAGAGCARGVNSVVVHFKRLRRSKDDGGA